MATSVYFNNYNSKVEQRLFEDLIVTGCHSILVNDFVDNEQKEKTIEQLLDEQKKAQDQHQKDVDQLTRQIEDQITKRRKVESDYQDLIKQIQDRHTQEIQNIAKIKEYILSCYARW